MRRLLRSLSPPAAMTIPVRPRPIRSSERGSFRKYWRMEVICMKGLYFPRTGPFVRNGLFLYGNPLGEYVDPHVFQWRLCTLQTNKVTPALEAASGFCPRTHSDERTTNCDNGNEIATSHFVLLARPLLRFFFGDFLAAAIRQILTAPKFAFIEISRFLQNLDISIYLYFERISSKRVLLM